MTFIKNLATTVNKDLTTLQENVKSGHDDNKRSRVWHAHVLTDLHNFLVVWKLYDKYMVIKDVDEEDKKMQDYFKKSYMLLEKDICELLELDLNVVGSEWKTRLIQKVSYETGVSERHLTKNCPIF